MVYTTRLPRTRLVWSYSIIYRMMPLTVRPKMSYSFNISSSRRVEEERAGMLLPFKAKTRKLPNLYRFSS